MNEFSSGGAQGEIWFMHWDDYAQMNHTHIHSQYELYFCPDETEQFAIINGAEYRYKYPCVIISSPYTVHAMSCIEKETNRFDRYVFNFDESIVQRYEEELIPKDLLGRNVGLMFPLKREDALILKSLIDTAAPQSTWEYKLLLMMFLNKLLSFCTIENAIRVGKPSKYLQDVLQFIEENLSEDLNVKSVAYRFSVSRSKLDRDFKEFTGMTVHNFLDICRLNYAKSLLEQKIELTIGEIAVKCGFSGENYFFPFFKKHEGMTPLDYRKQFIKL